MACFHWYRSSSWSSEVWKSISTLSLTTGQVYLQTAAGRPSSPGAFQGFILLTCLSIFSTVNQGTGMAGCYGLSPSSSMLLGRAGKKVLFSSEACSWVVPVIDLSSLLRGGIFSLNPCLSGSRYLAAFQMFMSSERKSSQWDLFCFQIASWYSLEASLARAWRYRST